MCRRQKPIGRTSHAATNDSPTTCRVSDSDSDVVVRARTIVTPEKALLEIVECLEGVLRNKCRFLRVFLSLRSNPVTFCRSDVEGGGL